MQNLERSDITFRPLTTTDLPLFHQWLARPHVAEWWDGRPTLAELEAEYGPVIAGDEPVECYLALVGGEPIGFIQCYTPADCHDDDWWLDEHDPGVREIDTPDGRALLMYCDRSAALA